MWGFAAFTQFSDILQTKKWTINNLTKIYRLFDIDNNVKKNIWNHKFGYQVLIGYAD